MGGSVHVESELGKGTQFFITLNIKTVDKLNPNFNSPTTRIKAFEAMGAYNFTETFSTNFSKTGVIQEDFYNDSYQQEF